MARGAGGPAHPGDTVTTAHLPEAHRASADSTIAAAELIQSGRCSPMCLLALAEESIKCRCRCSGSYHGALATAEVEQVDAAPGWTRHLGYDPGCAYDFPIVKGSGDFDRWAYQRYCDRDFTLPIVRRDGRTFTVIHDGELEYRAWPEIGGAAAAAFLVSLLRARRTTQVTPPPGMYVSATGVRSEIEARAVASVLREAWADNPCSAVRATAVLSGLPDPADLGLSADGQSGIAYLHSHHLLYKGSA